MKFDFLIDGYNLMHAAGLARPHYGPGDLERCRQRLLHRIRHGLTESQRAHTTVVFDGRESDGYGPQDFRFHGMGVLFSPPGLEADDTIEQLVASHSAPKQLTVISSDHRLHKAARVRKATAIDSDVFLEQLDENSRVDETQPIRVTPEKPDSNVDAEAWVEEFGKIDVTEIRKSVEDQIKSQTPEKSRPTDQPNPSKQEPEKNSEKEVENELFDDEETQPMFDLEFWESRIAELDEDEI